LDRYRTGGAPVDKAHLAFENRAKRIRMALNRNIDDRPSVKVLRSIMRLYSKDMDKVVKTKADRWSNPSIRLLAGQKDPLETMLRRARETVLTAMDKGWSGPPFDPIALSGILGISVLPRADIRDARTVLYAPEQK